jgi:hypothetical protein
MAISKAVARVKAAPRVRAKAAWAMGTGSAVACATRSMRIPEANRPKDRSTADLMVVQVITGTSPRRRE